MRVRPLLMEECIGEHGKAQRKHKESTPEKHARTMISFPQSQQPGSRRNLRGGESVFGRTNFDWKHVGRNCLPRSWSCGYSRCSETRFETVGHCDLGSSRRCHCRNCELLGRYGGMGKGSPGSVRRRNGATETIPVLVDVGKSTGRTKVFRDRQQPPWAGSVS